MHLAAAVRHTGIALAVRHTDLLDHTGSAKEYHRTVRHIPWLAAVAFPPLHSHSLV
jgi:hypothetical protein